MTDISASVIGVPRSFMLRRLSAHSPGESCARRMCCSSWQILHLFSVRVEPGPEMSFSSEKTVELKRRKTTARLSLNEHPDAMPAVPEVAERVPCRHRGLHVAAVIPCAREERHVAGPGRNVLVREGHPGVLVRGAVDP